MILSRVAVGLLGFLIVLQTLRSAILAFVVPRAVLDPIAWLVFFSMRRLFNFRQHWAKTYTERDRVMALYAPISLLMLLPVWLSLVLIGYMGLFWATGLLDWNRAFLISGSSLLTLGFASSPSLAHTLLAFSEATIGLLLVALLIAYLPTMYSSFSRREVAVTQLAGRAGTPPSSLGLITRAHRIGALNGMQDFWESWETLFAEIEESHTSLAALVFFRSPQPDYSWLTASGAVLDTAAIMASTIDIPRDAQAELCIRSGYLALRRIADFFDIAYNPNPHFPDEPICIAREEFDALYDQLAQSGVPLKPDREQAWMDFAGWRVNYDRVLVALCALIMAPYAPWSSDRSVPLQLSKMSNRFNVKSKGKRT